jgi:crossover junction endodeoxyribonuclease RuvC
VRIIGIDPGSNHLGWGVVEAHGSRVVHVASGTLHAPAGNLVSRLCYIAEHLDALLSEHQPRAGAVESIFHAKNSLSALRLGHARGVALLCLGRAGLSVHEYTPGQIKQAATGHGHADKEQVQTMVRMLLGLTQRITDMDTSDALAAALCHVQLADSAIAALTTSKERGGRR